MDVLVRNSYPVGQAVSEVWIETRKAIMSDKILSRDEWFLTRLKLHQHDASQRAEIERLTSELRKLDDLDKQLRGELAATTAALDLAKREIEAADKETNRCE